MEPVTLVLAAIFGTALATPAMATPVTWTFIETSCTSLNGGCQFLDPPPFAVGQLILPDINSSGGYHFFSSFGVVTETGDKDFSFQWGGRIAPPHNQICQGGPRDVCQWGIGFASSATGLDVSVGYFENAFSDNINIGPTGGMIGSDRGMAGCGIFAECSITGYWALTPVPEPSSLALLGIASALFSLGLWRHRPRLKTVRDGERAL
jgi:hypothetical protein